MLERVGETLILEGKMTQNVQDIIDDIVVSAFDGDTITARMQQLLMQKYKERSTRL